VGVPVNQVTIEQKGFADTCVWSPFGNEDMGFDKFICVEPVQSTPMTIPVGKFKVRTTTAPDMPPCSVSLTYALPSPHR